MRLNQYVRWCFSSYVLSNRQGLWILNPHCKNAADPYLVLSYENYMHQKKFDSYFINVSL